MDASELPSQGHLQNNSSSKPGSHSLPHVMYSLPPSLCAWLAYTCVSSQRQFGVLVMLLFSTTFRLTSLPSHFSGYRSCFFLFFLMEVPLQIKQGELLILLSIIVTVFASPFSLLDCPEIMRYLPVNVDLVF